MRSVLGSVFTISLISLATAVPFVQPRAAEAISLMSAQAGQLVTVNRQVNIDGRLVTVSLNVRRVIPGAPLDGIAVTTTADVSISIQDGALLPAGLRVVGVRMEKVRGPGRIFFTPVSPVDSPDELGFEVDMRNYQGGVADSESTRFLRAVVRLEQGSRVIKVSMGTIRVDTLALP